MTTQTHVIQVGAPDPEKPGSPIVEEGLLDREIEELDRPVQAGCVFNGLAYSEQAYVCSGNELLCCRQGHWVQSGSCDPDNP